MIDFYTSIQSGVFLTRENKTRYLGTPELLEIKNFFVFPNGSFKITFVSPINPDNLKLYNMKSDDTIEITFSSYGRKDIPLRFDFKITLKYMKIVNTEIVDVHNKYDDSMITYNFNIEGKEITIITCDN